MPRERAKVFAQKEANDVGAVAYGFGEVSFEDRERGEREDRGEQQADRPAATHLSSTLPMVPEWPLKTADPYIGIGIGIDCRRVGAARLLAESARVLAWAGGHLPDRVPGGAQPVPATVGRTRAAAGAALYGACAVSTQPEPVLPALFGSAAGVGCLARHVAVSRDRGRAGRRVAADPVDGGLAGGMGAVPVDRQRRPDVLRLRLGVAAARSGVLRRLPGAGVAGAAGSGDLDDSLAAVSRRVRCRIDQDPRRSMLAR